MKRTAVAFVLLLAAMFLFGLSRLVATDQSHAYDPAAKAPSSYHLADGQTYQLSSSTSVADLRKRNALSNLGCRAQPIVGGVAQGESSSLASLVVSSNDRDLHVFATFHSNASGRFAITCDAITPIFIDDAEDSGTDWSAVLMIVSVVLAVVAVASGLSSAYRIRAA